MPTVTIARNVESMFTIARNTEPGSSRLAGGRALDGSPAATSLMVVTDTHTDDGAGGRTTVTPSRVNTLPSAGASAFWTRANSCQLRQADKQVVAEQLMLKTHAGPEQDKSGSDRHRPCPEQTNRLTGQHMAEPVEQ